MISTSEIKYPLLCQRCATMRTPDGFVCGLMTEAMETGHGVQGCVSYRSREGMNCDSCGRFVCRLKNARIRGCKDHIQMDLAARTFRDAPPNEGRLRGWTG